MPNSTILLSILTNLHPVLERRRCILLISVSDEDLQLCFPGRLRPVFIRYFYNTVQLTLHAMPYHDKLALENRC